MANGPGLYPETGKKVRDLLYQYYQTEQKFTITSCNGGSDCCKLTIGGSKKRDLFQSHFKIQLKGKGVTADIIGDPKSNLFVTLNSDLLKGLKVITRIVNFDDKRADKFGIQYLHDYVGINFHVSSAIAPVFNFSGVVGTDALALGADVSYDMKSRAFTKYNAGLTFTTSDLVVTFTLKDMGDKLIASHYHNVKDLSNTSIGAEVTHRLSINRNTLTVGMQHQLNALTTVKAKVNNRGKASVVFQHEWSPKCLFTATGEVNTKHVYKWPEFGFSLAINP